MGQPIPVKMGRPFRSLFVKRTSHKLFPFIRDSSLQVENNCLVLFTIGAGYDIFSFTVPFRHHIPDNSIIISFWMRIAASAFPLVLKIYRCCFRSHGRSGRQTAGPLYWQGNGHKADSQCFCDSLYKTDTFWFNNNVQWRFFWFNNFFNLNYFQNFLT